MQRAVEALGEGELLVIAECLVAEHQYAVPVHAAPYFLQYRACRAAQVDREDYNGPLLDRVVQGEVDLAVCADSSAAAGLHFEHLFDDELVAVMKQTDPKAAPPRLRWSALKDESLVMLVRDSSTYEQISAALAANYITREADYEVANMFTALSMVRAGFGTTFIPAMVLSEVNMDGLAWKRLQRPVPTRRIGICRRSDRTASPAAAKFEELLRAEVTRVRLQSK